MNSSSHSVSHPVSQHSNTTSQHSNTTSHPSQRSNTTSQIHSKFAPKIDEWVFDSVLNFLNSPLWSTPIMTFIDQNCFICLERDVNKHQLLHAVKKKKKKKGIRIHHTTFPFFWFIQ